MKLIIRNSINVWKITIWNFMLFGIILVLLGLRPGISEAVGHKNTEKTVTRATLANGLRVVIVRNPIAPVVATVVNYRVGSNELRRAKAMLLREIPLTESSLGSIARGFIHRSVLDLPLEEPSRAA